MRTLGRISYLASESFTHLLFITLLALIPFSYSSPAISAVLSCDDTHQITANFENGSAWNMCWTSTRHENIVLSEIHYQPSNQQALHVISSIRLAQLHVTYDDSEVTYNDVTQFGLGGGYISTLSESDCPGGELIDISERAGLCKQVTTGDASFHSADESELAEVLTLFSVSQVGSYAYLVTWKFYDDGSIEPSIGAAGALQRSASINHDHTDHGRVLEGSPGKIWLSHTHNYYWRIDFDIGENAENDVVTEVSYPIDDSGRRPRKVEKLLNEAAHKINPDALTSWYVTDNAEDTLEAPGYLIAPIRYGHKLVRTEQEPFTDFDFFVTRQNDCERFISENEKFNPECGDNILDYTNNETLENQDIVVWHRISFHHVPRNEDKQHMHSHWDGFTMQARNLKTITPGNSEQYRNTAPAVNGIEDQFNSVGDSISLSFKSHDLDNAPLTYQHTGLPGGLSISEDGVVEGEISEAGQFHTTLRTSDGIHTTSTHFNWDVKNTANSGSGNYTLLILLAGILFLRKHILRDCLSNRISKIFIQSK